MSDKYDDYEEYLKKRIATMQHNGRNMAERWDRVLAKIKLEAYEEALAKYNKNKGRIDRIVWNAYPDPNREPPYWGELLVTVKDKEKVYSTCTLYETGPDPRRGGMFKDFGCDEVVAWAKMPEPYKEQKNE